MHEVDTTSFSFSHLNFGRMGGHLDSAFEQHSMDTLFDQMRKSLDRTEYISNLSAGRQGIVNIIMSAAPATDRATTGTAVTDTAKGDMAKFKNLLALMSKGAVLRGAVNADGGIQSFYLKGDQRNLVSLLFELPGKPVNVGDSWSLDVHMISMDQNFVCDSSYRKNVVTLVDIKKVGGETVAVLRYDVAEYVSGNFTSPLAEDPIPTYMKMTHHALASFSVDRGRWISYEAIVAIDSKGFMNTHVLRKISLIPD
jgi:hypothetical protein